MGWSTSERAARKVDVIRLDKLREVEIWIAWVRLGAIAFATLEVAIFSPDYPPGYERWAWLTTGVFAAGAVAIFVVSRRAYSPVVGIAALSFDGCVIAGYSTIYAYEYGNPVRWALIVVVI